MLRAAKQLVAGWGQDSIFAVTIIVCGAIIGLVAFLPWFDFGTFSISGIKLPGITGEALAGLGVSVAGAGLVATRGGPLALVMAFTLGAVAFALCTDQVFTQWQAGACGWGGSPGPFRDFVCRDNSDALWSVNGSPTVALWAATGLSAFVSLFAGWWLLRRTTQPTDESPAEVFEAWA